MTGKAQQLAGEPIILMAFNGSVREQDVMETYLSSLDLARQISGPVYRLVDLQGADRSFEVIVSSIREFGRGLAGAASYPELAMAFVGQSHMATACDGLAFFESMDAALEYARTQVAEPVLHG